MGRRSSSVPHPREVAVGRDPHKKVLSEGGPKLVLNARVPGGLHLPRRPFLGPCHSIAFEKQLKVSETKLTKKNWGGPAQ